MLDKKSEKRLEVRIFLDALQQINLSAGGQFGKRLPRELDALPVDFGDTRPVGLLQRFVETGQLLIEEMDDACGSLAGVLVFGDDLSADGLDSAGLFDAEESPGAVAVVASDG
jgi:hypothetical protein